MVLVNDKTSLDGDDASQSEESFVILNQYGPESIQNGMSFNSMASHHNYSNRNGMNGSLESQCNPPSGVSSSSELTATEIHKKLQDLVEENVKLKETLHQNNLAMKQQFQTLNMWQEQVFSVHQNHKQKFSETKELILKLKAENMELKTILAKIEDDKSGSESTLEKTIMELTSENASLKSQLSHLEQKRSQQEPSKKERELSLLLEQVNNQLENAERSKRKLENDLESTVVQKNRLEKDVTDLKSEMNNLRTDKQNLKEELEQLLTKNRATEGFVVVEKLENSALESSEVKKLQEENRQSSLLIEELQNQVLKLMEEKLGFVDKLPKCDCKLTDNLADWCLKFEIELKKRLESSDKDSVLLLKVISYILELMVNIKNLHAKEQNVTMLATKNLCDLREKHETLFREYHKLKECGTSGSSFLPLKESQILVLKNEIQSLKSQLNSKESSLEQSLCEMKKLREETIILKQNLEQIPILEAQVEVYRSDFDAERKSRENLVSEREKLAQDLRTLQKTNEKLFQDLNKKIENETRNRQDPQNATTSVHPGTASTPARNEEVSTASAGRTASDIEEPKAPVEFSCPVCQRSFNDYDSLERHVYHCLDINS